MRPTVWIAAGILGLTAAANAQPAPVPTARADAAKVASALRLAPGESVKIDGRLDEAAWQRATPIAEFVQTEPDQGQPSTERTEVRVMFDASNLYFGIACFDRDPDAVIATQLSRDADLDVDDRIRFVIDPFMDNRNGFFFETNPAGARVDGQVSNNSEDPSRDWDGIWTATARRTDAGWVAEIAIPFKTLRFKPGQSTWGLNVERTIKRRRETSRWASPRRDVWFTNLAEAGRLEGLVGLKQGLGLDLRPYGSAGRVDGDGKLAAGLDVSKNLTPNLNVSLTVNTDFAETEADSRQVNLTRFPLFYPEKRAFFLEGAGVFDVAGAGSEDVIPFFSRRIGLFGGREVPILVGAKLTGRQGSLNIGVLDVQTRALNATTGHPVEDDEESSAGPTGQNLLAARVAYNFWRQSSIGAIVTRGNPAGTGSNTLVGVDARLATSSFREDKNLSLDLFLLRTDDGATRKADYAGGFSVDYPNDRFEAGFSFKQIGSDFQPALGFVPRRGVRKIDGGVEYRPRPHKWGIRQLGFEVRPQVVADLHNTVENWNLQLVPVNIEMDSGEVLEFGIEPQYERLPEAFEIADGIVVSSRGYRWTRYELRAETASKRRIVVEGSLGWGGFYNGTRQSAEVSLRIKPSTNVAIGVNAERNDVTLPGGNFYTQVVELQADYNFSTNVFWANLVQYDTESRVLGVQSRFRWIVKPGNDVFFVVNRGWYRDLDSRWARSFDKLSAKISYTLRF
jgi:hypothetical protein